MIITRSPLRITLGGGGTDLPSYYQMHEGFLIYAAIDKYIYINVNTAFDKGIFLKYSQLERVLDVADVRHPIIRESLIVSGVNASNIEITTSADIPAGTGLGSSGSFTTGLIKALYSYKHSNINQEDLAELACHIEIDRLKEPIGKQDQYIASYGGISCFTFTKSGKVSVAPLMISADTLIELEDNLVLFFTGFSRSASSILRDQEVRTKHDDVEMIKNLHYVKSLGFASKSALESGDVRLFGELMHEHWEHKKRRSNGMSNQEIDRLYELAKNNGAIGGKLVGAGGGGFLMFMAEDRVRLRKAMREAGLMEVRFRFDFEGTKVVLSS
jgi:D-glycero-alpha-D-manno-heptose-7-phosphate kinase